LKIKFGLLCIVALGSCSGGVWAEGLSDSLSALKSSDWHVRAQAFQQLREKSSVSPHGENRIRYALFDLLVKENAYAATLHAPEEPKDGELIDLLNDQKEAEKNQPYQLYYSDLIQWVAQCEDPKALDSLIGALQAGGPELTMAIAQMGPEAIKPLEQKVRSPDATVQNAAAEALMIMAGPEVCKRYLDDVSRSNLADALKEAVLHLPTTADAVLQSQLRQAFQQVTSANWCLQKD
jgi:HEAT repeat protein